MPWKDYFWEFSEVGITVASSFLLERGQEEWVLMWVDSSFWQRWAFLWGLWCPRCSWPTSFLHPFPGLWVWLNGCGIFPSRFTEDIPPSWIPSLFFYFLYYRRSATAIFPFFPRVHFAPVPEAGRTCADEVGRSTSAFPTLISEASAKDRWQEADSSTDVVQSYILCPVTLYSSVLVTSLPAWIIIGAVVHGMQQTESHFLGV